ncbi:MAG: hypothetical protein LBV12_05430 [Puniceicoccales bacterium]|nr:hypothetical protein [Puniceicoccales bacterium]
MKKIPLALLAAISFTSFTLHAEPLQVSGVYPSLTHYNSDRECGPGALVPWAGKLWLVTYPAHAEGISDDKLYSIDPVTLERTEFAGSVGGTHANRLIHRESQQLFIGCYAIDKEGNVRVISRDRKTGLYGRLTATARHLTDPANKVYMVNMEGAVYEVNVHTLEAKLLFEKPLPGHHGKGAYTGQGRLVVSNNGNIGVHRGAEKFFQVEDWPKNPENLGVLGEWDGAKWNIISRAQYTEVTGPGGINGNAKAYDPVWSFGWDKRSVIFKLLDEGEWSTFRLPKGASTYDHPGGWYTEWPRIREVGQGRMLMDSHGIFFSFSPEFSTKNPQAPEPISTHLMYTADFCDWNGRLVVGKHSTTTFENPRTGRDQSAPWFGTWEQLQEFGPNQGFGSFWQNDAVQTGDISDPFLVKGFTTITLFLSANRAANFTLEAGNAEPGKGIVWKKLRDIVSGEKAWKTYPLETNNVQWIRLKSNTTTEAVHASLQSTSPFKRSASEQFSGMARIGDFGNGALLRPAAAPSKSLLAVFYDKEGKSRYREVNPDTLEITPASGMDKTVAIEKICAEREQVFYDSASAIVRDRKGSAWRLPLADPAYAKPFGKDTPTTFREIISERMAANIGGTFFIHGLHGGVATLQPVATHGLNIRDFCTWRGLLALSGVKPGAIPGGHIFGTGDDALWFGMEDDLWKAGKPTGTGGPWKATAVSANQASDPYLFFGYDKKTLTISHDSEKPVTFTVEFDADHARFFPWKTFTVKPGEKLTYDFPEGFSAFWIRFRADADCHATTILEYR